MPTHEMSVLGSLAGNQFGGDTDIAESVLGLNMPSDLNRAFAIIGGQEDPAIKQQGQNIQAMALIAGLKQKQEEMKERREQNKRQSLNNFLDFASKLDLDDETVTKITKMVISGNPELKTYFGEELGNLSVSMKSKTPLVITRKFDENELPDISRPRMFMPAGTYKLKGIMRQGQFMPTEIEPEKTTRTPVVDEIVRELASDPTTGKLDPERAKVIYKDLRTNPQGLESRAADLIFKKHQGKATPEDLTVLEELKGLVGGFAASRAGGAKVGGETAEMGLPLREKAIKYIHPEKLTTPPSDISEQAALQQGYRAFLGSNAPQFVTSARAAFEILNRWEALLPKIYDPKSEGFTGRIKNAGGIYQAFLNADPDAVEFFALQKSTLPLFARSMGDVANIAIAEQQFQEIAMPKPTDTLRSASRKISSRKNILKDVLKSSLGIKPIGKSASEEAEEFKKKFKK